ncbi:MAG TPA: hypothetical protein VK509_24775 [Polyangiales bacterium]|nr:hypothetical protein [Polyangiales bacterium]
MPLLPPVPASRSAASARLVHELLAFPARYLAELPIKVRIRVQYTGLHREIELCSGPVEARRGTLRFEGSELRALALGAEAGRLFPADVKGYCLLKLHDPAFEVSEQLTLGGVAPVEDPGWTLARVLNALDLEVRSAEIEGETADQQADQGAKAA